MAPLSYLRGAANKPPVVAPKDLTPPRQPQSASRRENFILRYTGFGRHTPCDHRPGASVPRSRWVMKPFTHPNAGRSMIRRFASDAARATGPLLEMAYPVGIPGVV